MHYVIFSVVDGVGRWKYVWKKKQPVIFELGLYLKPNHWETVANIETDQFLRRFKG